MSGGKFHVHGPHDHHVEHAAQGAEAGDFAGQVAVMTAILATVGALFSYMGGLTQANAGIFKNDAAIKKTAAADQWNFYQAKSTKQALSELAVALVPEEKKARYLDEVERYKKEKNEIKGGAEKLEAESHAMDLKSESELHVHHRWAQATTALQVAIALAAMALLTRRKWLEYGMFGISAVGLVLGGLALAHI